MGKPSLSDKTRAARHDALVARLLAVYDELQRIQVDHNRTAFKCQRSGGCCQVGLTVHAMECENLARAVRERFKDDPAGYQDAIERLKLAFTDPDWTHATITGLLMCAMWDTESGCTIYLDRPAVCRMYGVIMTIDDFCPRERMSSGEPFLFANDRVDALVKEFYATVDAYGRLYPERDYSIFMPAGVLSFLLPPEELAALKRETPPRFWKKSPGYRTQFMASRKYERSVGNVVWLERSRIEEEALAEPVTTLRPALAAPEAAPTPASTANPDP